jgi:2-aminobenzoate-CoA ligase
VHFVEELLIVPDSFGKYGWRVQENDVIGGSAPLAFGAGYSSYATIPFRFGAAASLIAKFEPEKMFETIQKHRVTVLTLAPTAYRKMLQVPDAEKKYDLSSLRVCTGGGESLTAPTYYAWKEKFGHEIFEGLGTTEMMYVFASNVVSRKAKAGSFGQAVPGFELKVVDEEGKEAAPGTIGHFVARGPTGTLYWRDPDKQQHALTSDRWNRAGDYVSRDEDGYFWFVSREDDIIKSSAYRIGPEEIEVTLATHPDVLDVGVIGVPDEVRGQIAKAFVVLKPGGKVTPEELIKHCKDKIATFKLPREVVIVNELPRTPTGKLLRRVLRQKDAEAQAAPQAARTGTG